MSDQPLFVLERRDDGVCIICLNRRDIHNAFDDRLIRDLTACLEELSADDAVRVIVLTGEGKSFSGWRRS